MDERIQKITRYIVSCPLEDLPELSLKYLSRKFEISVSHLSREFQKQKKILLSQLFQHVRITRSVNLMILNPDLTIKEISGKVGYKSIKHFRKTFKKYYSVTPSTYRTGRSVSRTTNYL